MLKKMLLKCAATRPDGSSDQNITFGTPLVRSSSATAQCRTQRSWFQFSGYAILSARSATSMHVWWTSAFAVMCCTLLLLAEERHG
jgi:hypothetical protein